MKEIWKDIKGYEGIYQVSNVGQVKSLNRTDSVGRARKGRECALHKDKKGYSYASLSKNGKMKKIKVHRLVATAFLKNPKNKTQVNHIDGIKHNNIVSNLEWVTGSENVIHSYKNELRTRENLALSKLSSQKVRDIRAMILNGRSKKDIAEIYKVSERAIHDIKTNKTWKNVPWP